MTPINGGHEAPFLDPFGFSRAAVLAGDLRAWTYAKGLQTPRIGIQIADADVVHLEWLLGAIEAAAADLSDEHAAIAAAELAATDTDLRPQDRRELIENAQPLPFDREYPEASRYDGNMARHYLSKRASGAWRKRLQDAITAGDLRPFDRVTGEPIGAVADKTIRRDDADVFIEAAIAACGSSNAATVWTELQKIASSSEPKPGTLIGLDEDGLKYTKNGTATWMTRDALSKRLKRRQAP